MANIFSGKENKVIPHDLKSCYKPDPMASALWRWADGLLTAGKVVLVILILIGAVVTVNNTSDASKLIEEIGEDGIEELRRAGVTIPSALDVFLDNAFKWITYAVLEFCGFFALSLIIGGLASIVQHNKITADIALYRASKDFPQEAEPVNNTDSIDNKASNSNASMSGIKSGRIFGSVPDISEKEMQEYNEEKRKEKKETITAVIVVGVLFIILLIGYFFI